VSNILKHDVIVLPGGFGQDAESRVNPDHENAYAAALRAATIRQRETQLPPILIPELGRV
jgi:LmbE family N-acetylglucosaminyl deacetylase